MQPAAEGQAAAVSFSWGSNMTINPLRHDFLPWRVRPAPSSHHRCASWSARSHRFSLRCLAERYLANQVIARTNASEACAALGERRDEREDVAAYLLARSTTDMAGRMTGGRTDDAEWVV
jgi:hypothetical protein